MIYEGERTPTLRGIDLTVFRKEIAAMMFHRKLAEASGINTGALLTAVLFLTGFSVALSLKLVGGLLVYALIINPTSTAYQFTYDFRKLVVGSPCVGVATCLVGFWASLQWDLPIGTSMVMVSAGTLAFAILASPKRRRGWMIGGGPWARRLERAGPSVLRSGDRRRSDAA